MNFTLRAPCPQCPFRTDITPYLHPERAKEIADMLTRQQGMFSCHKTVNYDDDDQEDVGNHIPTATEEHCAGALIMLEHMNQPNQMMRISERLGFYDRRLLKMDAPVFTTAAAFVAAHKRRRKR